jgi:hypothetical protein
VPIWPNDFRGVQAPSHWLLGCRIVGRRSAELCPACGYDLRATPPTAARSAGNPLRQGASKPDNETPAPDPAQCRDSDVTVAVCGDDDPVGAELLGDRSLVVESGAGVHYDVSSRCGLIVISRSALTGRTSDIYSDSLDRGPDWSFDSSASPNTPFSPFTPEGSHPAWQWLGFDHVAYTQSWSSYGVRKFRRIIFPLSAVTLLAALPSLPRSSGLCGGGNGARRAGARRVVTTFAPRPTPNTGAG